MAVHGINKFSFSGRMPYPLLAGFLLLFIYWIYIFLTARPIIIYDAIGYEGLGRAIVNAGWVSYFRHGPEREPFFPFVMSLGMRFQAATGIPYFFLVKGVLMLCLAGAMALAYRLLRALGVGITGAGLAALYLGFSPTLLNTTQWIWSEALTYPWIFLGIILTARLWRVSGDARYPIWKTALLGVGVALAFFALTMVKGMVAYFLPAFFFPFVVLAIRSLMRRDGQHFRRIVAGLLAVGCVYGGLIHAYKLMNKQLNGQYALTNRGDWALFGNTVRRLQPLTPERVAQAVLSVPRLGLCERYYGRRECYFWDFLLSNKIAEDVTAQMTAQKVPPVEQSKFFVTKSLDLMKAHPFQQAMLMGLEATKMFFWENWVYFVEYPEPVRNIYHQWLLVWGLCFGWAVLGMFGFVSACWRLCSDCRNLSPELMFTVLFVLLFVGGYSFFFIDLRHIIPLGPLLVVLAVAGLGSLIRRA